MLNFSHQWSGRKVQSNFRPSNGPVESSNEPFDRAVHKIKNSRYTDIFLKNRSQLSTGSWYPVDRSEGKIEKFDFET